MVFLFCCSKEGKMCVSEWDGMYVALKTDGVCGQNTALRAGKKTRVVSAILCASNAKGFM